MVGTMELARTVELAQSALTGDGDLQRLGLLCPVFSLWMLRL